MNQILSQVNKKVLLIVGGLLALIMTSSFFVVSETDQYVITRFGKPVRRPISNAGLHFKLPIIEKANRLDKRILEWDGYPNQVPTRDKKYIKIDATARWRIIDPLKFIQTVRTESGAQSRLDDIIDSAAREAISRHDLVETVRNSNQILEERERAEDDLIGKAGERLTLETVKVGHEKIQQIILKQAAPTITEYGIELIDVRMKRLNYEDSVQAKVFDRMISERKQIAEKLRSEGMGKTAEIEGQMQKELNQIESDAYRKAEEIKGKADAEATAIYAEAYNRDPEFFDLYSTLQSYKKTLDEKVTLLLSSQGEFLRELNR